MTRATSERRSARKRWPAVALGLALALVVGYFALLLRVPSDRTPEGAYLRVAKAVTRGRAEEFFAYLEEPAQHACYTVRDYRRTSLEVARGAFPASEFEGLSRRIGPFASAPDGADVFALYAEREGWLQQLRADVSGVRRIELAGERATVETVRGTRYSFRRRPNGIWGMTAFTPTLVDEAERAARDTEVVRSAAADYARARR